MRRGQVQMLSVWGNEKDRHIIHTHQILDWVKQSREERLKVQMRDGSLDERLAQVQLAHQERVTSGRSGRSFGRESVRAVLIRAVQSESPGLHSFLGRTTRTTAVRLRHEGMLPAIDSFRD